MTATDAEVALASQRFNQAAERTSTLYALSEDYLQLLALIEQAEDEDDVLPLEVALDQVAGDIRHKAESIAGLMAWLDGLAAMRRSEAKRMAESASVFERRSDRLRDYVLSQMQVMGLERLDTGRFTLQVRTNPHYVLVLDAAQVPHEYERTKITIEIDKKSILQDFKASGAIPSGVSIERLQRLEIK